MKAILTIEMPESCFDCPCESEYVCGAAQKKLFYEEDRKPEWCPLKETPNKMIPEMVIGNRYSEGIVKGWNDCLEEIEK